MTTVGDHVPGMSESTVKTLALIGTERGRQEEKFPDQHLPDGTCRSWDGVDERAAKRQVEVAAQVGDLTWRDVIAEEVAEAFNATGDDLIGELVQVAALCVRWIEDIRRRP